MRDAHANAAEPAMTVLVGAGRRTGAMMTREIVRAAMRIAACAAAKPPGRSDTHHESIGPEDVREFYGSASTPARTP